LRRSGCECSRRGWRVTIPLRRSGLASLYTVFVHKLRHRTSPACQRMYTIAYTQTSTCVLAQPLRCRGVVYNGCNGARRTASHWCRLMRMSNPSSLLPHAHPSSLLPLTRMLRIATTERFSCTPPGAQTSRLRSSSPSSPPPSLHHHISGAISYNDTVTPL
jgi:hypothetical protein